MAKRQPGCFCQYVGADYAEALVANINNYNPTMECHIVTNPGGIEDPVMAFIESVKVLSIYEERMLQYFVDGFIRAWHCKK